MYIHTIRGSEVPNQITGHPSPYMSAAQRIYRVGNDRQGLDKARLIVRNARIVQLPSGPKNLLKPAIA
jgi:hypothetical protein